MIRWPWDRSLYVPASRVSFVPVPDACPECGSVHHVDGQPVQISHGGISQPTGSNLKRCVACLTEFYCVGGQVKRLGWAKPAPAKLDPMTAEQKARKFLETLDKPEGMADMRLR